MKIWLDTINTETIRQAQDLGILYGITTNPSIIAQSGKSIKDTLHKLLDSQDGPVTAQVTAPTADGMITQGMELYDFSDRIIVKVPATKEGYQAIHVLSEENIQTMATVVFFPYQALIAAQAGATFIAPYLSQIEKLGHDMETILYQMISVLYNTTSEILAASVKSIETFEKCAEIGVPHITLKDDLFEKIIDTPAETQERLKQFEKDMVKKSF